MIDFSDTILELIEDIEAQPAETTLSETDQNIVNVVETAHILDEEGLHGFWMSPVSHESMMKSFDTVGAQELLDMFQSSQWCQEKSPEQELTETELSHLEEIEEELSLMLDDLPGILDEYLEDEIG